MEWQQIETAPKDGAAFIGAVIRGTGDPWLAVWRWGDFGELGTEEAPGDWVTDQWEQDEPPTHWIPLPRSPVVVGWPMGGSIAGGELVSGE